MADERTAGGSRSFIVVLFVSVYVQDVRGFCVCFAKGMVLKWIWSTLSYRHHGEEWGFDNFFEGWSVVRPGMWANGRCVKRRSDHESSPTLAHSRNRDAKGTLFVVMKQNETGRVNMFKDVF